MIDENVKDLKDVYDFKGGGFLFKYFLSQTSPEAFTSCPCVGRDLVCLWVLELPILKLLTRIVCFSLMQESL